MGKIIGAVLIAASLFFVGSAQAGILNSDGLTDWQGYVDNLKDTENYEVGVYAHINVRENTPDTAQYAGLRLYDFVGTEEVPSPEGESVKEVIPYVSLIAGYALPSQGVVGISTHVDAIARQIISKTPLLRDAGVTIPEKVNIGLGYGIGYDFDRAVTSSFDEKAVTTGFILTGGFDYKF